MQIISLYMLKKIKKHHIYCKIKLTHGVCFVKISF